MFVVSPMSLLPCVSGRSPAIISIKLVFLQANGGLSAAAACQVRRRGAAITWEMFAALGSSLQLLVLAAATQLASKSYCNSSTRY